MAIYIIDLNDTEDRAMQFVCADVNDWMQNLAHARAFAAIDELVSREIKRMLECGQQIPLTKEEIVAQADISHPASPTPRS
jgi:hypothetical protein